MFDSPRVSKAHEAATSPMNNETDAATTLSDTSAPLPVKSADHVGHDSPDMLPERDYRIPVPARSTFRPVTQD